MTGSLRYTGIAMSRRRIRRLATTVLAVTSLLLSQIALAQYVCPQQAGVEAMRAMMEAGVPCDGMDPEQPALCHEHSADPGKTVQAAKLPPVSLPAIVQVLELPQLPDAGKAWVVPHAATPEAQPPPDPIFLSTLRLRV